MNRGWSLFAEVNRNELWSPDGDGGKNGFKLKHSLDGICVCRCKPDSASIAVLVESLSCAIAVFDASLRFVIAVLFN